MEKINEELQSKYVPSYVRDDDVTSHNGGVSSVFDSQSEAHSDRSHQLSEFSKRSGITNFSSGMISKLSKPTILPKEPTLIAQAEKKDLNNKLRDIDKTISQARGTEDNEALTADQMKALLAECRREADALEMMEVGEDMEDDDSLAYSEQKSASVSVISTQVVPYEGMNAVLIEAKRLIKEIEEDGEDMPTLPKSLPPPSPHADIKLKLKAQEDEMALIMKELDQKELRLQERLDQQNRFDAHLAKEAEEVLPSVYEEEEEADNYDELIRNTEAEIQMLATPHKSLIDESMPFAYRMAQMSEAQQEEYQHEGELQPIPEDESLHFQDNN